MHTQMEPHIENIISIYAPLPISEGEHKHVRPHRSGQLIFIPDLNNFYTGKKLCGDKCNEIIILV